MTLAPESRAKGGGAAVGILRDRFASFGGQAARTFAAKISGLAVAFALQVTLARALHPAGYGDFVLVFGILQVAVVVIGCGMPFAALRFVPRYRADRQYGLLRGFIAVATAATLIGACVAIGVNEGVRAYLFTGSMRPELDDSLRIGSFLSLPMSMLILFAVLMQADGQPVASEFVQNGLRFVLTLAIVALALFLGWHLDSARALMIYGGVTIVCTAGLALIIWRSFRPILQADRSQYQVGAWFASGGTMLVVLSASILNERLDLLLVGTILGSEQAGIYSAAQRIAQLLTLGTASVNAVLAALISARFAAGDHVGLQNLMTKAARLAASVTIPATVAVVLLGPMLLGIFGEPYRASAGALNLLAASQLTTTLLGSIGGLVVLTGHNWPVVLATFAAVGLNIALGIVLIPTFGLEGAAAAQFLATQSTAATLAIWVWRRLKIDTTVIGIRGQR